jgi:hypothetical protein
VPPPAVYGIVAIPVTATVGAISFYGVDGSRMFGNVLPHPLKIVPVRLIALVVVLRNITI